MSSVRGDGDGSLERRMSEREEEKIDEDASNISSLFVAYDHLNSIVDSTEFQRSLDLYSSMSIKHCSINRLKTSPLQDLVKQVTDSSVHCPSVHLSELMQICTKDSIRSLVSSYDSIVHVSSNENEVSVRCSLSLCVLLMLYVVEGRRYE